MRKLLKLILNRIVIFGLALCAQLVWFTIFVIRLSQYSVWISVFLTVLSILVTLWIINKDENPVYKLAWIVPILLAPLFGGLLYLMAGNKKPSRKLRRRLEAEAKRTNAYYFQGESLLPKIREKDLSGEGQMRYIEQHLGYPVCAHTAARYYELGDAMFPDMLEALEEAEHFIFLEYFIIGQGRMWNTILEILERKAKEGVKVRVIYDDMGCVALLPLGYDRYLEQKGIQCMAFNPFVPFWSLVMNNRDHRKMLIIDGHTAFSGGINLADEYINEKLRFGHWKDTGFCIRGDGVWNYTMMFLQMWHSFHQEEEDFRAYMPHVWHPEAFKSDGYVQPYGDSPLDSEVAGENIYLNILSQARRYVYIFTPYLIIDNEMQTALCLAAKRGVDVRIVTPGIPDKKLVFQLTRSMYPPLLRAGVRIYEYTPGFIHAKSYVCDDEIAVVGTINMDYRSLYLHFECGTYFYQSSVVRDVRKDAEKTIAKSREIQMRDTRQGFFGGLLCAVLRMFAPLL
ncbi:MAG: cardiolipin synthase [Lachnospiraceae bacterium]|nr:cardiolipin synthase [Lachnospiraceae bacterium]